MGGEGSGRRIRSREEKRHQIIDKAWELVRELLHSDKQEKYATARDIVVKDITQTLKGEGFNSEGTKIIIVRNSQEIMDITPRGVNVGNPIQPDTETDPRV